MHSPAGPSIVSGRFLGLKVIFSSALRNLSVRGCEKASVPKNGVGGARVVPQPALADVPATAQRNPHPEQRQRGWEEASYGGDFTVLDALGVHPQSRREFISNSHSRLLDQNRPTAAFNRSVCGNVAPQKQVRWRK